MKKCIAVFLVLVFTAGVIGIIGKQHIYDCGIMSAKTIRDVNEIQCYLEVVDSESQMKRYKKMLEEGSKEFMEELDMLEEADNIAVVVPTGKVKLYETEVIQEVEVQEVKKGDTKLIGKTIMIEDLGAGFRLDKKKSTIPNCYSIQNIMQENTKYLCFFNNIPLNQENNIEQFHLAASGLFDCLDLEHTNKTRLFPAKEEKYKFGDLADVEFFCNSQELLDAKNTLKEKVIEKYCG